MPCTITSTLAAFEASIVASNSKRSRATGVQTRANADSVAQRELIARYNEIFTHYNSKYGDIEKQHNSDSPSPTWIKTQNLVRNCSKRISGKVYQRSTRWCANLEQRADRIDKFDNIRLFQHGAKRGR